jgi:hypothetical protein
VTAERLCEVLKKFDPDDEQIEFLTKSCPNVISNEGDAAASPALDLQPDGRETGPSIKTWCGGFVYISWPFSDHQVGQLDVNV